MTDDQVMIAVPAWALAYVMDHACFADVGGCDEGWSSPEMERARAALEAALGRMSDV